MTRLFIALLSLVNLLVGDSTTVLECVADMQNPVLRRWGYHSAEFNISDDVWEELLEIQGNSVWVGYENGGWNVPDDVIGAWEITGENSEIWIWQSESTYKYYVFPFNNTLLFADANGDHYGMHPCGGWEVDRSTIDLPIIDVINEGND